MPTAAARAAAAAAALLLLLPLAGRVHAQELPPQCDPVTTTTPQDVSFLGLVQSKQIGKFWCAGGGRSSPPPACRPCHPCDSVIWSSAPTPATGDIDYSYHLFGADSGKPPLVMIQGLVRQEGGEPSLWPAGPVQAGTSAGQAEHTHPCLLQAWPSAFLMSPSVFACAVQGATQYAWPLTVRRGGRGWGIARRRRRPRARGRPHLRLTAAGSSGQQYGLLASPLLSPHAALPAQLLVHALMPMVGPCRRCWRRCLRRGACSSSTTR